MKQFKVYLFFLCAGFLISCSNFSESESGLRYRILHKSKNNKLPAIGEYLQCFYSLSNDEDSVFYNNFGMTPARFQLQESTHAGGDVMEAFGMLSPGDSAQFLINADSFFYKTRRDSELPEYIKPGSLVRLTVKMDRFLNAYQVDSLKYSEQYARYLEEINQIKNYVNKQGMEVKLDTATAIRYQFHKTLPDTAKKVREGDLVRFHFIGKLMDGTEFFNSYTSGKIQTIKVDRNLFEPKGMYEMVTMMREGEKATFILPYDLGFGATGIPGLIPPFSTLVYEINIIKVQSI